MIAVFLMATWKVALLIVVIVVWLALLWAARLAGTYFWRERRRVRAENEKRKGV
jgi:steroid 5-alpha reductase family enzyme